MIGVEIVEKRQNSPGPGAHDVSKAEISKYKSPEWVYIINSFHVIFIIAIELVNLKDKVLVKIKDLVQDNMILINR